MFIVNIVGALICGWLLTKVRNRKLVLVVAVILSTALYPLGFSLKSASMIVPYVSAIGFVPVFIATTTFTIAPETMPAPELGGLAMGILTIGQNVGSLIGPPIIGNLVKSSGSWAAGNYPMLIVMLISSVAALIFASLKTSKAA